MKEGKPSGIIVERFRTGDDILERLNALVRGNNVSAGSFSAIGAVEKATVGIFVGEGQYSEIEIEGPWRSSHVSEM